MPATHSDAQDADAQDGHRLLDVAMIVLWLCVVTTAFWWFALRDLRPFSPVNSAALFTTEDSARIARFLAERGHPPHADAAGLTLLHLRDPDCRCNRFTDPHVAALRQEYATRGVRIETIPVSKTGREQRSWLPATPAALLLDAQGRVLYLGPMSESANCGRDSAPVERALGDALAGVAVAASTRLGTGCFCS